MVQFIVMKATLKKIIFLAIVSIAVVYGGYYSLTEYRHNSVKISVELNEECTTLTREEFEAVKSGLESLKEQVQRLRKESATPIEVHITNNSNSTIEHVHVKISAFKPGYSTEYSARSLSTDKIIAPGESFSFCSDSVLTDLPREEWGSLDWEVADYDVTFE